MTLNTISPSSASSLLIAEPVQTIGGSSDSTSIFTQVNGSAVDALLELQAKDGGFLMPRLTTAQKNALNVVPGFQVYDSTLDAVSIYLTTGWQSVSVSSPTSDGIIFAEVTISSAQLVSGSQLLPIIASPGTGKMIQLHNCTMLFLPGSVLYDSLSLKFTLVYSISEGSMSFESSSQDISTPNAIVTNFMPVTGTDFISSENVLINSEFLVVDGVDNNGCSLSFDGGIPSSGNGVIKIKIWYSIVSTT